MEIELKLLVDAPHVEALRAHPLLKEYAAEKPHEQKLVSTYYDTPEHEVRKRDAALRVRKAGRGWVQALKGGGSVDSGLHSRHEWESRVGGPALDPVALRELIAADTEWGKLVRDDDLLRRLAPVFSTRVTRTIWELRLPDGTEVECALDLGTLEHADKKVPVSELELELKAGTPARLFDLALRLLDHVPMRIGNLSKAERGYALSAPQQAGAVNAGTCKLNPEMTVEHAFREIAAGCIAHVQGNESGVVDRRDPESLHQMRVGLRRLRSAFRIFGKRIPVPEAIAEECGWLADELGTARDWDVLSQSTLARVTTEATLPEKDRAGFSALAAAVSGIAETHHARAAEAVASVRYTRLLLNLARWLQEREWRTAAMPEEKSRRLDAPLKAFAARKLARSQRRLLKRGRRLRDADAGARHRLRIAAKRARYATEFFRSLYPARRVRRYLDVLSALQDELGWLNDVAVADRLLQQLQQQRSRECAHAAAYARGYLAASIRHDQRRLRKLWKRFKRIRPPGRKAA